jgi:hypothetical protein
VSLVSFFALRDDLLSVLEEVESKSQPVYTLAKLYPSPTVRQFERASNITQLGIAAGEQTTLCDSYLITDAGLEIHSAEIRRWDGSVVYSVDQSLNPESVMLTAAGKWREGIIIAGNISSVSNTSISHAWMRKCRASIKRRFTRINAFWVGPSALQSWKSGCRLTIAQQSPPEYDLKEIGDQAASVHEKTLEELSLKVTSLDELLTELQETSRKRRLQ